MPTQPEIKETRFVFVIDDQDLAQSIVSRVLKATKAGEHYRVIAIKSEESARYELKKAFASVACIFMDGCLGPGVICDTLGLMAHIRTTYPDIPIIGFSSDSAINRELIEAGCMTSVHKNAQSAQPIIDALNAALSLNLSLR